MKYQPEKFELEETTVWSFKERGNWATHRGDYRGNCSPQVPRNLILRYTKKNDIVLDQTTLNMIQDISSIIARKPMIIGEI